MFVWVENNFDETKNYKIKVEPYNTDKIEVKRFGSGIGQLEWNEQEMWKFEIYVNDDAGIYFTTWLEITVYDSDEVVYDSEKVFFVVTTDFDRSIEEQLYLMIDEIQRTQDG